MSKHIEVGFYKYFYFDVRRSTFVFDLCTVILRYSIFFGFTWCIDPFPPFLLKVLTSSTERKAMRLFTRESNSFREICVFSTWPARYPTWPFFTTSMNQCASSTIFSKFSTQKCVSFVFFIAFRWYKKKSGGWSGGDWWLYVRFYFFQIIMHSSALVGEGEVILLTMLYMSLLPMTKVDVLNITAKNIKK